MASLRTRRRLSTLFVLVLLAAAAGLLKRGPPAETNDGGGSTVLNWLGGAKDGSRQAGDGDLSGPPAPPPPPKFEMRGEDELESAGTLKSRSASDASAKGGSWWGSSSSAAAASNKPAKESRAERMERESKLESLVQQLRAEIMAKQEEDIKSDVNWLKDTMAAERANYDKEYQAYLQRKRAHDVLKTEWEEKYGEQADAGEDVPPAPVLSPGPPNAPIFVNQTVVDGFLERVRLTTSGGYRFEVGDAIAIFGLPRTGSTVLFNVVRLLVREIDPNVVSGFGILFEKARQWKAAKVSIVMKLHELAKSKKMVDGKEIFNPWKEHDVFEAVIFSHRKPGDQICSWCHLLGDDKCRPPKGLEQRKTMLANFKHGVKQKCYRLMGIQNRLYKNLHSLMLYDFSYEDEISSPPASPFASGEFDPFNEPHHRRILSIMTHMRLLLGMEDRVDDIAVVRLAREMSRLRAISVKEKGKHPADWEHPVTLMHVSCAA